MELEEVLILSDIGAKTSSDIIEKLRERIKEKGLDKVMITCRKDNIASARVMEKRGFRFVLEKTRKLTDGTTRAARYHILDNPKR
mgnify:CR=1 FL=1